jgi:lipid-A-disaccharide synthase
VATGAYRVAIVAGETSGDQLGAALIAALRERCPELQVRGVCGPLMAALGCEALASANELSVMGLAEVLAHLPRLLGLRRRLRREFSAWRPEVFIGIDAPEFNLGLAAQLHKAGVKTVQYVSPQVWAWRESRVSHIARTCDLVLCLLPFEPPFYARHAVRAEFVGHPLADQIPLDVDRVAARQGLGLEARASVIALLPGSRSGEVARLAPDFLAAASLLAQRLPAAQFILPVAATQLRSSLDNALHRSGLPPGRIRLLDGQARAALQAADVALVASGTASLEALLCDCPMVVAYRVSPVTAFMLRALRMVRLPYFSLPNLLAGAPLVPEFLQEQVTPAALAGAVQRQLEDEAERSMLRARFRAIHESLRQGGAARAARAVLQLRGAIT